MHEHTVRFGTPVSGVRTDAPCGKRADEHRIIVGHTSRGLPIYLIAGGEQSTAVADFGNALKTRYNLALRTAIDNSNVVSTEIGRNTEDFVGEEAVWSIHSGRSGSSGNRAERAKVPTADRQRYVKARDKTKTLIHTIKVTTKVIKASRTDEGAFRRAKESEMTGAENDLVNDYSRQSFGLAMPPVTGAEKVIVTGGLARVKDDPGTGATVTLESWEDGAVTPITRSEMRYFFQGMTVVAINPATGLERAGGPYTVQTADEEAGTVTIEETFHADVAADDWLVRGDAAGNSYGEEIYGLRVLIGDATSDAVNGTDVADLHGLNSGTTKVWNAMRVGDLTTPIGERLLNAAYRKPMVSGNGAMAKLFLGSYEQEDELAATLNAQKKYEGREVTLTAGWVGLKVARGIWVSDKYCPETFAALVTPEDIVKFVLSEFDWDDEDGKVLFKTSDELAYEARFYGDINHCLANRNSHTRIVMKATEAA